jgi:hypothetical protein
MPYLLAKTDHPMSIYFYREMNLEKFFENQYNVDQWKCEGRVLDERSNMSKDL